MLLSKELVDHLLAHESGIPPSDDKTRTEYAVQVEAWIKGIVSKAKSLGNGDLTEDLDVSEELLMQDLGCENKDEASRTVSISLVAIQALLLDSR